MKNPRPFQRMPLWAVLAISAGLAGAAETKPGDDAAPRTVPPGLQSGDTLAFYGDSITHGGLYTRWAPLYYYTRYPDVRIRFFNAGVGGNSAGSALHRFRQDIIEQDPDVVTVLFGMNDGGYQPFDEEIFARYKANMLTILDRLKNEAKARAILLTPSMYDAELRRRKRPGNRTAAEYNKTLIRYGDWLRKVANERKLPIIDLNAPMTTVTETLRKKDPNATLSRDGIHPAPAGDFILTHAILKGFGAPALVSRIHIDTGTGKTDTERCELSNLKTGADSVTFDALAEALPMPYPEAAGELLALVPFTRDLNQETLRVGGLAAGDYQLTIDGKAVGAYGAKALADGVNLAENTATPQHKQALAVMAVNDKLQEVVLKERRLRLMEKKKGYRKPDGTYPRKKVKRAEGPDGETRWVPDEEWEVRFAKEIKAYPDIVKRIAELEDDIYRVNQPEARRYVPRRKAD